MGDTRTTNGNHGHEVALDRHHSEARRPAFGLDGDSLHTDESDEVHADQVNGTTNFSRRINHEMMRNADTTSMTSNPSRATADFFSPEIFQIVLRNPITSHQLLEYSRSRFCGENLEFLEQVDRYNILLDELTKTLSDVYYSFTSPDSPRQLGISPTLMQKMNKQIKHHTQKSLPPMESIFTEAQLTVENTIATEIYPRFVKHKMTVSATKALAMGPDKYGGLGDCFCMTEPDRADNPIVYASDGFLKVTGYSRTDVIPRNCRFLQGRYTDQAASKRLATAIRHNQESVELLLNYRKNGEPFWNLLYVTPLLRPDGSVAFFLGGQINCSTTIHGRSDILRILSMSDKTAEGDEDETVAPMPTKGRQLSRSSFFSFRTKSKKNFNFAGAGMERGLVDQISNLNLKNQMEMFYTAYSKYLVLSYPALAIEFFSQGFLDILILDPRTTSFVGVNVFQVLERHANSVPRDYKNNVKGALKMGRAMSSRLDIVTRRSLLLKSSEEHATHWTPLKDERGVVRMVVLTAAALRMEF